MMYPNIEAERIKLGLTEAALAKVICVTPKTVNDWQAAKKDIPASKIFALASLFHVSTDYLLSRTASTAQGG